MTQNLARLQLAVDDATFHRQRAPEDQKRRMEKPKVAEDVRYLYLGPRHFMLLEKWVKSFKDSRRRDWSKIQEAMRLLDAADRAHAWAHFMVKFAPEVPNHDHL